MLYDNVNLPTILLGFEQILRIEYNEMSVERIINTAKGKLENTYQVYFTKNIFDLQAENRLVSENINILLDQITASLSNLALFNFLSRFNKNAPINLGDVNYFGFTEYSLRAALKVLQQSKEYAQNRDTIIPPLRSVVSNIETCTTKRLFVIMLMLDELGIYEAVGVIAEILYLGAILL